MANAATYFTGEPCPKGHTERYVSDGGCVECKRERSASPKYREKQNAHHRERSADPEYREKRNSYSRKLRANPEYCEKQNASKRERRADPEYHEKVKALDRERRRAQLANPEVREKENARMRERRADPEYRKKYNAKQNSINLRKLEEEAGRQNPGFCEICGGKNKSGKNIAFDHCHQTGKFRGWLCDKCNRTLGYANDNADLLIKLATYLKKHGSRPDGDVGVL